MPYRCRDKHNGMPVFKNCYTTRTKTVFIYTGHKTKQGPRG